MVDENVSESIGTSSIRVHQWLVNEDLVMILFDEIPSDADADDDKPKVVLVESMFDNRR